MNAEISSQKNACVLSFFEEIRILAKQKKSNYNEA
jgi:hypothetical protein